MGIKEREITQAMTATDMTLAVRGEEKQGSCHIGKKISKQAVSFKEKTYSHRVKKKLTARPCCQLSRICLAVFYRSVKTIKNL